MVNCVSPSITKWPLPARLLQRHLFVVLPRSSAACPSSEKKESQPSPRRRVPRLYSCRRPDRTPCLPGSPTPVLRRPPSQVTLARSAVRRCAVPTPPTTHPTTIHPPDHCGQYRSWSGSKPSSFQPSPPPALTHLQLHPSDCRRIKARHHHASSSSNKRRRGEELMVQGWTPRGVGCCTRRTSAAASRSPKMCSRSPSAAALLCSGLLALVVCVHSRFTAEFVNGNTRHFLLTCTTQDLPRDTNVIAVKIYNFTTSHILAWVAANDGHPKFGNGSVGWNRFVSGRLASGDGSHAWLQVLHLDHDDSHTAYFGCNISVMRDQAHIVDIVLKTNSGVATQRMDSIAPTTSTKATTPASGLMGSGEGVGNRVHETETQIRTGNVLQPPTVLETGVPMTVLIVLIVLITVLVVITMALLLQKFRGRCAAHELHHYPPPNMGHYSLAGNTPLDNSWEEKMTSKGSHPSIHCMPRSHYSLPRPPPPPLPKLTRSRSRNYASNGRIPGTVRSHYMTPYDAIAQDSSEDGDLSLLNTSRHDLTPSLPPEVAGESTYNVPRGDLQGQVLAQAQTPSPVQTQLPVLGQGQVHTFYPCTTLKTPHPLPLE